MGACKGAQHEQRAGDSGCDCDQDCHDDEHGRSYGLVARTTLVRRSALPAPRSVTAARADSISDQGLWVDVPWWCLWDRREFIGFRKRGKFSEFALCRQKGNQ